MHCLAPPITLLKPPEAACVNSQSGKRKVLQAQEEEKGVSQQMISDWPRVGTLTNCTLPPTHNKHSYRIFIQM